MADRAARASRLPRTASALRALRQAPFGRYRNPLAHMNIRIGKFGNRHTPQQTLLDALSIADELDFVVVVVRFKEDNGVTAGWSDSSMLEKLGLLTLAQYEILEAHDRD